MQRLCHQKQTVKYCEFAFTMSVKCQHCDEPSHTADGHVQHMTDAHFHAASDATFRCPICLLQLRKKVYSRHFNNLHLSKLNVAPERQLDDVLLESQEERDAIVEVSENDGNIFYGAEELDGGDHMCQLTLNGDTPTQDDANEGYQLRIDNLYNDCDTFYQDLVSKNVVSNKLAADIYAQYLQIIVAVCHVFQSSVDSATFQSILEEIRIKNDKRRSNYRVEKTLQTSINYIPPKPLAIGYRTETTRANEAVLRRNNLALVPIEDTLKTVLSNPAIANALEFTSDHLNDTTVHPLAAERSMNIYNKVGDSILLQFYLDGYGTSNPLGYASSTNKLLGCYYRILNLPDRIQTLDTVFLCFLVLENDVKSVGIQEVLRLAIVQQLEKLQQICVTVKGKPLTLPVAVHSFVGDSLGVHEFSGFVCHFRGVSSCRFCLLPYNEILQTSKLESAKLKSRQWYEEVMQMDPTEWQKFGIKCRCVLNQIRNFHILDSHCSDIMHDLLEGHLRYLMADVSKFVIADNYTLDELNSAIHSFPYDGTMRDSRPNIIFAEDLRKGQIQHTTAVKMLNLTVMLPLILFKANKKVATSTVALQRLFELVYLLDLNYDGTMKRHFNFLEYAAGIKTSTKPSRSFQVFKDAIVTHTKLIVETVPQEEPSDTVEDVSQDLFDTSDPNAIDPESTPILSFEDDLDFHHPTTDNDEQQSFFDSSAPIRSLNLSSSSTITSPTTPTNATPPMISDTPSPQQVPQRKRGRPPGSKNSNSSKFSQSKKQKR